MATTPGPRLILASASPRRLALLGQIGIAPAAVETAAIDEHPLQNELPRALAERLAAAKADAIARRRPDAFVLAADTVVACGRRVLPKVTDQAAARAALLTLSGRRHRVHTAISLIAPSGRRHGRLVTTVVAFKRLSEAEIARYLASGEWRDKAGGYAIQGRAAAFVPWINGSYSNVVGLPLHEVAGLLEGCGYSIRPCRPEPVKGARGGK